MTRLMLCETWSLTFALLAVPAGAGDPPKKLTPEERKELETKWKDLTNAGVKAYRDGSINDAVNAFQEALTVSRRVYPKSDYPEGHERLADVLNGLAFLLQAQGKFAGAEPHFREALEMRKRLFPKQDHPDVATSLNNLAALLEARGKPSDAEPLFREALDMRKRLFPKQDHPDVATSINNLAFVFKVQGKLADAEPLYRESLAMTNRLYKGDHPALAANLNNLAGLLVAQGKLADAEPFYRKSLDMRKRLFKGDHPAVALSLNSLGVLLNSQEKYADAEPFLRDAMAMQKRLFNGDHPDLALILNNLAHSYDHQRRAADAEPLYRDAIAMRERLFKGDHPLLAQSLTSLASLLLAQSKYADAEPLFRDALAMAKRLHKDDHPDIANSLNGLASLLHAQGKLAEAEPVFRDALDMRKRMFKDDHPDVAHSLNNLAALLEDKGRQADAETLTRKALEMLKRLFPKQDRSDVAGSMNDLAVMLLAQHKYADAESMFREALDMRTRLHKEDHPEVAGNLANLAFLYQYQGKYADAEPLFQDALDMRTRLFKGDHPDVVRSQCNLAFLYMAQRKHTQADLLFRKSLAMDRRLVAAYAGQKTEGEVLTLVASTPSRRDAWLSNALMTKSDPQTVYLELWASKSLVSRAYEQRTLAVRASASDPKAAKFLAELADTRRRRAELILAPAVKDPAMRNTRLQDIKDFEKKIAELDLLIGPLLPTISRAKKLAASIPAELQKVLPIDAAVVDFLRFTFVEQDKNTPGKAGEKWTDRYLAIVLTKDEVMCLDLDTATKIEAAVTAWREAILGGKEIATALPAKVRELVWNKIRKELPANVKTVYISPDAALCRVPWTALPGDKPGTILLEDYAIATIPHAIFLLDKLWQQDPLKNPPTGTLVVGGVKYDADLSPAGSNASRSRGHPLVRAGEKLGWSFLPGTVAEVSGVSGTAAARKLTVNAITDHKATTAAVLAALPKAKYAHFATHGYFADPSFRSVFQLDEKDYEKSWRGERIGRAANSPLVMTGLVLAGANNPKTPGRGIVTGEALIDLDLSGLELAVLSACETGLGDVAGGEGTFGLQRAFHLAGTRDVVASLWKVPDQSTAALMSLFYRNLWEKNLAPMESLRQAQLEIYRNPGKIAELAKSFRGKFNLVPGDFSAEMDLKPGSDGRSHPQLWAAFILSGPGR
jgi:CHAT domain-containing protein/Tfp pilus assembly protein PilF